MILELSQVKPEIPGHFRRKTPKFIYFRAWCSKFRAWRSVSTRHFDREFPQEHFCTRFSSIGRTVSEIFEKNWRPPNWPFPLNTRIRCFSGRIHAHSITSDDEWVLNLSVRSRRPISSLNLGPHVCGTWRVSGINKQTAGALEHTSAFVVRCKTFQNHGCSKRTTMQERQEFFLLSMRRVQATQCHEAYQRTRQNAVLVILWHPSQK